jgi:hypothetical protein
MTFFVIGMLPKTVIFASSEGLPADRFPNTAIH